MIDLDPNCKKNDHKNLEIKKYRKKHKRNSRNYAKRYVWQSKKELTNKITKTNDIKEFKKIINNKQIALVPFCGRVKCEEEIKDKVREIFNNLKNLVNIGK